LNELAELLKQLEAVADEHGIVYIEIEPSNYPSRYSVATSRSAPIDKRGYGDTLEEAIQEYLRRFVS
jgi:hypothetical protein